MELFKNTNYDFLGKKWPFIIASLILTGAGFISMAVKGLNYGIDFKGGTQMTVKFASTPPLDKIREAFLHSAQAKGEVSVQNITDPSTKDVVEIGIGTEQQGEAQLNTNRTAMEQVLASTFGQPQSGKIDLNNTSQDKLASRLSDALSRASIAMSTDQVRTITANIARYLSQHSGLMYSFNELNGIPGVTPQIAGVIQQETYLAPYHISSTAMVGPKVGAELRQKAVLATLYALGGMLVYIAFRFEWIYGVGAVIAVFHDTLITIGLFSIFNEQISMTVIAALLTLVGYSMNDTIVIFDRIRENLKLSRRDSLERVMNVAVNQTLSRTVMTSGLTFITAVALFLFGGPVLHGFSFALVCGILVGTYSSVFIASPIVLFWHNYADKPKKTAPPALAATARTETVRKPTKAVK
ncbi:MAG TPA: protein translocase subunit SecF [Bryobacteraceae bacterium]|jgi:preprotein translocase subunit SecF|nr:protein translocase subunit SecF [Bryobacteraceae bacterium]